MYNKFVEQLNSTIDKALENTFYLYDLNNYEEFYNTLTKLIADGSEKFEGGNEMIKTSKNTVFEYFNSLGSGTTGKKEVTESAFANFPYTSKNFIIECYKEWSKGKKVEKDIESSEELSMDQLCKIVEKEQKQEKKVQRKCELNEKDLKSCSENDWDCAICEHMEDSKITKEEIGISKAQEEQAQKTIDTVKAQGKPSNLKVVEDVRKITVEGLNGTYEAETNLGVVLKKETAKISFANEEELEEFTEEFKQVFAMIR